jgi:hypothetical protein
VLTLANSELEVAQQVSSHCTDGALQGNLSVFVEKKPEAKAYYDLKEASIKFTLPEPGFLEGVKSKDRAILKMHSVGYTCAPLASPHNRLHGLTNPGPAQCCTLLLGIAMYSTVAMPSIAMYSTQLTR